LRGGKEGKTGGSETHTTKQGRRGINKKTSINTSRYHYCDTRLNAHSHLFSRSSSQKTKENHTPQHSKYKMAFADVARDLFSPEEMLKNGLQFLQIHTFGKSESWKLGKFRSHYGADPITLANQWYDLCLTDIPGAKLTPKERSLDGLKRFLMAHFFLWQYPKNSVSFASRFKICERYARGEHVWYWVDKIAALKEKVIVWTEDLDAMGTSVFSFSVDGTDFKAFEKKHPTLNQDKKDCSKKFNHGAMKYEIAMSVFEPRCVWIYGPHRGAKHDLTIFREQLKGKIKPWKKVIADSGYVSSQPDEIMLCPPNTMDSKELAKFKSRARLRHETFNGRLKDYLILSQTYRHSRDHHRSVVYAVAATIQYEMNNGAPIFDV
jgi:hypothetical protein